MFTRYSRYVAAIAHRLLGDATEVEDVVQETFTDAAMHLGQLRELAGIKAWLGSICVRRVRKRLVRRRRWRWLVREAVHFEPITSDPAVRASVLVLYDALEQIDPDERIPWEERTSNGGRSSTPKPLAPRSVIALSPPSLLCYRTAMGPPRRTVRSSLFFTGETELPPELPL